MKNKEELKKARNEWTNCATIGHSFVDHMHSKLLKDIRRGATWSQAMDLESAKVEPYVSGISGHTADGLHEFENLIQKTIYRQSS